MNSLRPSYAYMRRQTNHHWFRWWLVAWTAPSHYLNQCWNIINWTLGNKLQWNFNQNSYIFIHENALKTVVWKKAAILSRPQCVKSRFMWFQWKFFKKIDKTPYTDIFRLYSGPKRGQKFGPHTHTLKSTVNHVLGSGIKSFFEKMAKNLRNCPFWPIFVIKVPSQTFEHTHTYKNSSNLLVHQVSCDSKIFKKILVAVAT